MLKRIKGLDVTERFSRESRSVTGRADSRETESHYVRSELSKATTDDEWWTTVGKLATGQLKRSQGHSRKSLESAEQRAVLKWLKTAAKLGEHDYAANNEGVYLGGGENAAIRGAIAKANGVKKGRPDIEIYARVPRFPYARGVALEMKSAKGRATPEQLAWLERLTHNGWVGYVAHGADEAIGWLKTLGFGQ